MSRFLDHVTILFRLLRTWEIIVIGVTIIRDSTIGYISNSWASCEFLNAIE